MALKKQFNAIKYTDPQWLDENGRPWLRDIHRDAHARPFAHLAKAWARFFADLKAGKQAHAPRFKKKGRCRDNFYVANDKFRLDGKTIRLPKIGDVALAEALRFRGKILGATVSRTADRWFVAVQVEVPDAQFYRRRTAHDVKRRRSGRQGCRQRSPTAKPSKRPSRLKRRCVVFRSVVGVSAASWKLPRKRQDWGAVLACPKERACRSRTTGRSLLRHWQGSLPALPISERTFTHKLTTRLCRENQALGIEDLNVKGMLANEKLARAISDVGFGKFRSQMEYKATRYRTRLMIADRWYPSSRLCSVCGWKNEALTLRDREWSCARCGARTTTATSMRRCNLKRLATATALPVASPSSNGGATAGRVPAVVGKVTPVRDELAVGRSGQEENRAHFCALS
jgi:putative transposase